MASHEAVTFSRDTEVIIIPDGYPVPVPEGTQGWVTQELGGNYTVQLDNGRLVRVPAEEADVIGKEVRARPSEQVDSDKPLDEQVWDELKTCYDPEIPLNIVELGLVYECEVDEQEDGAVVSIDMTLTAPGCGMGQVIADDVQRKVQSLPGVKQAQVEIVFDPPWSPEMLSEAGRLQLGLF